MSAHVLPVDEADEHRTDWVCPCKPVSKRVELEGGERWAIVHHPLPLT